VEAEDSSAFMQMNGLSFLGSATPQSGSSNNNRNSKSSLCLCQAAVIIEKSKRATMDKAESKEKTGHQNKEREASRSGLCEA
jgi:hypothetical protein